MAVMPLIPVLLPMATFAAYLPYLVHQRSTEPPVSGAAVIGRAEISGLFANVEDSGKKLDDGRPVFAEISPGTPRSFSKKRLPEIVITSEESGGLIKEDVKKSFESSRTFGVGEAV
jgi:hypothetical protein